MNQLVHHHNATFMYGLPTCENMCIELVLKAASHRTQLPVHHLPFWNKFFVDNAVKKKSKLTQTLGWFIFVSICEVDDFHCDDCCFVSGTYP